jgi:hypothetical protein
MGIYVQYMRNKSSDISKEIFRILQYNKHKIEQCGKKLIIYKQKTQKMYENHSSCTKEKLFGGASQAAGCTIHKKSANLGT